METELIFSELRIESFKKLQDVEFKKLANINIFDGKNMVLKLRGLEAVASLCYANKPRIPCSDKFISLSWISEGVQAEFTGRGKNIIESYKLDFDEVEMIENLFVKENKLENDDYITGYIYQLLMGMSYAKNGVYVIEALAWNIHATLLPNFARFIVEMVKYFNIQLFCNTLNNKFIHCLLKEAVEAVKVYSFEEDKKNGLSVKYTSGERLLDLMDSFSIDILNYGE